MDGNARERVNPASALSAEIRAAIGGRVFATLEEANAFLSDYMQERNARLQAEFQGWSPDRMQRLLYAPFESPDHAVFADPPADAAAAPVVRLFALLAEGIGAQGLKPTATGNLPRALVRSAALALLGEDGYRDFSRLGEPRTELDFRDLHALRLTAGAAGLVRKYKGKFILSRECRRLLDASGPAGAYLPLLRAYATRFNWAYQDCCDELPLVQQSFLFTVHLLQRFGGEWRDASVYEDAFLTAFPGVVDEAMPRMYFTPEESARQAYALRALQRFAVFFGLAETREVGNPFPFRFEIHKRPLADQAVRFA